MKLFPSLNLFNPSMAEGPGWTQPCWHSSLGPRACTHLPGDGKLPGISLQPPTATSPTGETSFPVSSCKRRAWSSPKCPTSPRLLMEQTRASLTCLFSHFSCFCHAAARISPSKGFLSQSLPLFSPELIIRETGDGWHWKCSLIQLPGSLWVKHTVLAAFKPCRFGRQDAECGSFSSPNIPELFSLSPLTAPKSSDWKSWRAKKASAPLCPFWLPAAASPVQI